jgi:hypothetical protein
MIHVQLIFLKEVIQSWLRKKPTPEFGSSHQPVFYYRMWMMMRKKKSDTLMSRRMTFRM